MDALQDRIPAWAKDLRLNLSALRRTESLTEQQLHGTFLAAAVAARNADVLRAVAAEADAKLTPEAAAAARAAAAVMGMNNVYYRFVHLASNAEYGRLPARLRMQVIANPGVDKLDFELWSLAVSAVNGCGACIDSHEKVLREAGASAQAVQDAVRIAAVVHGVAAVLDAEAALAPGAA